MSHGAVGIVGFAAILTDAGNRLTPKIYHDIISAIHLIQKAGEHTALSNIGHRAHVPNSRLEERLRELVELGLIDARMSVTQRGYEYLYGLQERGRAVSPPIWPQRERITAGTRIRHPLLNRISVNPASRRWVRTVRPDPASRPWILNDYAFGPRYVAAAPEGCTHEQVSS